MINPGKMIGSSSSQHGVAFAAKGGLAAMLVDFDIVVQEIHESDDVAGSGVESSERSGRRGGSLVNP